MEKPATLPYLISLLVSPHLYRGAAAITIGSKTFGGFYNIEARTSPLRQAPAKASFAAPPTPP